MMQLRSFERCLTWVLGGIAFVALVSCAASSDPAPTMGNTNWLHACDADDDCSDGLSCECRVCTRVCTESSDCSGLPGAVCELQPDALSCGANATDALCVRSDAGACEGDACQIDDAGLDSGSDAGGDGDGGSDVDTGHDGGGDAGRDAGPTACEDPAPQGCAATGCPDGQRCDTTGEHGCVSSGCRCDAATGQYQCTPDCGGGTCVDINCEGTLRFDDYVLEQVIRATLEKPSGDIVAADVASLTELNNEGKDGNVASLVGIQCLTSLTSITIRFGHIADLKPLAALDNLRYLTLTDHEVLTDLSPLAELSGLQGVFITNTQVQDVSPLASLTSAVEIALEGNRIRDIRPLEGLTSLDLLWLTGNPLDCALNADAITSLEDIGVDVDAPQCD
jgi:hypothetical protein